MEFFEEKGAVGAGAKHLAQGVCVVFGLFVVSIIMISRWGRVRILPNLAGPATAWLMAGMFIRAGLLGWWRGGIAWRGTLYQDSKFRSGKRVHFP